MRLLNVWKLSGLFLTLTLLTNCATVISNPQIRLVEYDHAFQRKAAQEIEQLRAPCAHDVLADCSAVRRMVVDYGDLRQKLRAAKQR